MQKRIHARIRRDKEENEMLDLDAICALEKLYLDYIDSQSVEDYEVNPPQMDRFLETLSFFRDAVQRLGGEIEPFRIDPRAQHAGFTAVFSVFDLYGLHILDFGRILPYLSAFSVDGDDGRVFVSLTVPNVYMRKNDRS
ncbi:MAG: hypothetical protein IJT44_04765 [Clostridia bacterium]|nr:hypothetical protein [Clostridia bacterium]